MFGYVNVLQDELKIGEFKVFKAYYCGLCKELSLIHIFCTVK